MSDEHTCIQERVMGELLAKMSNNENAAIRMELALTSMLATHNTDKLESLRGTTALSTDIAKISLLLDEVNQRNASMESKQDNMITELATIRSKVQAVEHDNGTTKEYINELRATIEDQRTATASWRDSLSRRITRLERISYWLYAIITVSLSMLTVANYVVDLIAKLKQ